MFIAALVPNGCGGYGWNLRVSLRVVGSVLLRCGAFVFWFLRVFVAMLWRDSVRVVVVEEVPWKCRRVDGQSLER